MTSTLGIRGSIPEPGLTVRHLMAFSTRTDSEVLFWFLNHGISMGHVFAATQKESKNRDEKSMGKHVLIDVCVCVCVSVHLIVCSNF